MTDPRLRARILRWALFVALAGAVYFLRLLPTGSGSGGIPGPDWEILLAFAWVLRRPDCIPAVLFAAVVFLGDILFLRPPGLWSVIALIGLEFLRSRARFASGLPLLFEWALVGTVLLLMTLGNRIALTVFLLPRPEATLDILHLGMNLLAYPFVVGASGWLFGVRHELPGGQGEPGQRP